MRKYMYYTPEKAIPAFVLVECDDGDRLIEILNPRTGKTDLIPVDLLVHDLTTIDLTTNDCFNMIIAVS